MKLNPVLLLVLFLSCAMAVEVCPLTKIPTELSITHVRDNVGKSINVTMQLEWTNLATKEHGSLAAKNITAQVTVYNNVLPEEEILTDEGGTIKFSISTCPSADFCVDPDTVSYNITAVFKGDSLYIGSFKSAGYKPITVPTISATLCLPFVLIIGILMAAMYASGKNPFGYLDFSRMAFRPPRIARGPVKGMTIGVSLPEGMASKIKGAETKRELPAWRKAMVETGKALMSGRIPISVPKAKENVTKASQQVSMVGKVTTAARKIILPERKPLKPMALGETPEKISAWKPPEWLKVIGGLASSAGIVARYHSISSQTPMPITGIVEKRGAEDILRDLGNKKIKPEEAKNELAEIYGISKKDLEELGKSGVTGERIEAFTKKFYGVSEKGLEELKKGLEELEKSGAKKGEIEAKKEEIGAYSKKLEVSRRETESILGPLACLEAATKRDMLDKQRQQLVAPSEPSRMQEYRSKLFELTKGIETSTEIANSNVSSLVNLQLNTRKETILSIQNASALENENKTLKGVYERTGEIINGVIMPDAIPTIDEFLDQKGVSSEKRLGLTYGTVPRVPDEIRESIRSLFAEEKITEKDLKEYVYSKLLTNNKESARIDKYVENLRNEGYDVDAAAKVITAKDTEELYGSLLKLTKDPTTSVAALDIKAELVNKQIENIPKVIQEEKGKLDMLQKSLQDISERGMDSEVVKAIGVSPNLLEIETRKVIDETKKEISVFTDESKGARELGGEIKIRRKALVIEIANSVDEIMGTKQ